MVVVPSHPIFEMITRLLNLPLKEAHGDFLPRRQPVSLVCWFMIPREDRSVPPLPSPCSLLPFPSFTPPQQHLPLCCASQALCHLRAFALATPFAWIPLPSSLFSIVNFSPRLLLATLPKSLYLILFLIFLLTYLLFLFVCYKERAHFLGVRIFVTFAHGCFPSA